jgi:predicted DNA-binding WGR domain protein
MSPEGWKPRPTRAFLARGPSSAWRLADHYASKRARASRCEVGADRNGWTAAIVLGLLVALDLSHLPHRDTFSPIQCPRRRKFGPECPAPIQLPLFAEFASLIHVRPEANEWRFYRMEVWPDLFGRALLVRHWGRLGTQGRQRLDPHPDPGAAMNALATLLRAKRRRGYQDRHA